MDFTENHKTGQREDVIVQECNNESKLHVQQSRKRATRDTGISRFMSESNEGVCTIEGMIRDVKATRVDTDSDHAECVLTRMSTTGAHPVHGVNIRRVQAKRMMMIDFGKDVAQCVVATDSSSIKSAVERRALWLRERVHFGSICVENWRGEYNIAERATKVASVEILRTHLKTLKWSGVGDVISKRYVQWCDGLSEAS